MEVEVWGTEGRAYAWDNGDIAGVRRRSNGNLAKQEMTVRPSGESPTVCTIRDIIREMETGQRTAGNIDVTMQAVEAQFAIAESHLRGGTRVSVPIQDRSLYIPGG